MSRIAELLRSDTELLLCRDRWAQHEPAHPNGALVVDVLARVTPAPVLGRPLDPATCLTFDWSVDAVDPPLTPDAVQAAMDSAGADVGIGRYAEDRAVYRAPAFYDPAGGPPRTMHMGVDLFVPAGRPIHAPLSGVVHALADNDSPLDYGPVVILEHEAGGGVRFYTLYGHLSRDDLAGLSVGAAIGAGERFASIGTREENGGWVPHLHLQVIVDLFGFGTDFPGVVVADELALWLELCPDPAPLIGVPTG